VKVQPNQARRVIKARVEGSEGKVVFTVERLHKRRQFQIPSPTWAGGKKKESRNKEGEKGFSRGGEIGGKRPNPRRQYPAVLNGLMQRKRRKKNEEKTNSRPTTNGRTLPKIIRCEPQEKEGRTKERRETKGGSRFRPPVEEKTDEVAEKWKNPDVSIGGATPRLEGPGGNQKKTGGGQRKIESTRDAGFLGG